MAGLGAADRRQSDSPIEGGEPTAILDTQRQQVDIGQLAVTLDVGEIHKVIIEEGQ